MAAKLCTNQPSARFKVAIVLFANAVFGTLLLASMQMRLCALIMLSYLPSPLQDWNYADTAKNSIKSLPTAALLHVRDWGSSSVRDMPTVFKKKSSDIYARPEVWMSHNLGDDLINGFSESQWCDTPKSPYLLNWSEIFFFKNAFRNIHCARYTKRCYNQSKNLVNVNVLLRHLL